MAYEIFERKMIRMGTPAMSFSKIGQIVFNVPAAHLLKAHNIENILLMWDSAANKLEMKTTTKDNRAYIIRYNGKGNGANFSAKTFLNYAGIDYSERKSIPIEINPNSEFFIEVMIPGTFFKK